MSEFCHVPPKPTVYHQAGRACTYTEGRQVQDGTAGLARLCAECALAMVKHEHRQLGQSLAGTSDVALLTGTMAYTLTQKVGRIQQVIDRTRGRAP